MFGKYKFSEGQRVRLSDAGKKALVCPKTRWEQSGIVQRIDRFNSPTVLWDGRKTTSTYHPDFIEPDRRRNLTLPSAYGNEAKS